MRTTAILAAVLLSFAASAASAQQWQVATGDDGAWFGAAAKPSDHGYGNETVELFCGGRSPQGLPLTAEHHHAIATEQGTVLLRLGQAATGSNPIVEPLLNDIRLLVDGTAYPHPPFEADMLDGQYDVTLPVGDPLITALRTGNILSVAAAGTAIRTIALRGSGRAIGTAIDFCAAKVAPAAASTAATGPAGTEVGPVQRLQIAVGDELTALCRSYGGRSVTFHGGAVETVPAPGSGNPDVIFNFHHITCNGASTASLSTGVGHCGAGPCLHRRFSDQGDAYVETGEYYQ